MDLHISQVSYTKRGNVAIIVNNFRLSKYREMKDGLISFVCTKKSCNYSVAVDKDYKKIVTEKNVHNHEPMTDQVIERACLQSVLKRKGTEDLCSKPNKLIRRELNSASTSNLEHSDIRLVRKSMYEARRNLLPPLPTSLEESLQQLFELSKMESPKFCYMKGETGIPLFTNVENLELLCSAPCVFADGTFSRSPMFFSQLYTIHVFKNGFYVPVIFAFLSSKSTDTYRTLWSNIKELCLYQLKLAPEITDIYLDFELAAHNAIKAEFPTCNIHGCNFHLCQSWYRRIQKDKKLLRHYRGNSDVGKWLKLFYGLSYIPHEIVYNAFTSIMLQAPVEGMQFSYYVLTTYIEEGCSFPPHIWAAPPALDCPRTTNGAEAFHRDFNRQFYNPHPNIHHVIKTLEEVQAESSLKIRSILKGSRNPPRKQIQDKVGFLLDCWEGYLQNNDILAYLTNVTKYAAPEPEE